MPTATTAKLKTICRVHDISGYSGKRKSELIKLVSGHYHDTVKQGIAQIEELASK